MKWISVGISITVGAFCFYIGHYYHNDVGLICAGIDFAFALNMALK